MCKRSIRDQTANWMNAFLLNHTQVVSINGIHSNPVDVVSGVHQGSVLGPFLFLLYINDFTTNIDSTLRLFADDSVIYREIHSHQDQILLQQDLEMFAELGSSQGPVVQSPISANPGLNFNLLFLFMYFCMIIHFKTLGNKTSIEPEKISGKTYST